MLVKMREAGICGSMAQGNVHTFPATFMSRRFRSCCLHCWVYCWTVQPGQVKLWQQFLWVLWYDLLKLVVTNSLSRTGQLYWIAFEMRVTLPNRSSCWTDLDRSGHVQSLLGIQSQVDLESFTFQRSAKCRSSSEH